MRPGTTLPELLVVMTVVGVLGSIGLVRMSALRDRISVRAATTETVATFALARRWAISRASRTALTIDTAASALLIQSYVDTVAYRHLGSSHGVRISATRDSMAYAPNGLGYGASNLTLVLKRGQAAETIFVSRLGRVRR